MDYKIAQRLQEYRKAHHLSQEELADKLGVSRQAVSKWERGESSPDTDNLIALAKLYNVSIDCLLGDDPISSPKTEPIPNSNEEKRNTEEKEDQPTPKVKLITAIVSSCASIVITIVYFILGFCFHQWAKAWLVFMLIPIIGSICDAILKKSLKHFAYPVLIAAVYITIGLLTNLWHPFWLLFLTIPLYYMILDIVENYKKVKKMK